MLRELVVHNFALIDRLRIQFGAGANLLTGETGAGKSIIIDALGLLLGGRTATRVARLDEAGRVAELARMLGGRRATELGVEHAREMLSQARRGPRGHRAARAWDRGRGA